MKKRADHISKFRRPRAIPKRSAPLLAVDSSPIRSQGGSGLSSSQRVANERVRILTRICQAIDYHAGAGHPLAPHFRKFSRQWRGAFYLAAPERPVRLSAEIIRKNYYRRWKRSGRNPQALHYRHTGKGPHVTLTDEQRGRLITAMRTTVSLPQIYKQVFIAAPRLCYSAFQRFFTDEERNFLRQTVTARKQARDSANLRERRFEAWLTDPTRTFAQGIQS